MSKIVKQGIVGASHRLRAVQRGFADESEPRQMEHVGEELENLLKEVPYGERRDYLQKLLAQFPVGQAEVPGSSTPSSSTDNLPPLASEQPVLLAETLVGRFPSLPPDEQKAVLDVLQQVVPEASGTAEASGESILNLRSTLHLSANVRIHEERLGTLANHLAEVFVKLEQLTATVWTKMCSKSALRPPRHIEQTAGRFLSGDKQEATELVKELRSLLQFITGIMTAAGRAGDAVGGRYARKFSPEAIRTLVEMEQGRLRDSLLSTKEGRCWRKYCELAGELSAEHMEREMESTMADCAEAFVKGLERLG